MADRSPAPGGEMIYSLISAGLFLYVGFGLGLEGISGNALYDGSVAAFVWGARIIGLGLLVVAALNWRNVRWAAALDLALAALAAAGCLLVGAIWLAFADMQGVLLILFGLWNAAATGGAWRRWCAYRRASESTDWQ